MTTDGGTSNVRGTRALALLVLVGGFVAYVRGNDAEATAVFDAGGDAGMWGLGIIVVAVLLLPGAVLLLISLGFGPRTLGAGAAAVGGVAVLAASAFLAVNLCPPARETSEGVRLDPEQWRHVADLYLVAVALMAAAGAILLVSAFSGRARRRSASGALQTTTSS